MGSFSCEPGDRARAQSALRAQEALGRADTSGWGEGDGPGGLWRWRSRSRLLFIALAFGIWCAAWSAESARFLVGDAMWERALSALALWVAGAPLSIGAGEALGVWAMGGSFAAGARVGGLAARAAGLCALAAPLAGPSALAAWAGLRAAGWIPSGACSQQLSLARSAALKAGMWALLLRRRRIWGAPTRWLEKGLEMKNRDLPEMKAQALGPVGAWSLAQGVAEGEATQAMALWLKAPFDPSWRVEMTLSLFEARVVGGPGAGGEPHAPRRWSGSFVDYLRLIRPLRGLYGDGESSVWIESEPLEAAVETARLERELSRAGAPGARRARL